MVKTELSSLGRTMPWKFPKGRQFVKGQRPWHWRPVGSEYKTDNEIIVKISEQGKWRAKHLVVWEAANGPLPKGARLVFRDGDRFNCALENLRLEHRGKSLKEKTGYNGLLYVYVLKPKSHYWRLKHLAVWEEVNGPIPKGYTLIFADGNPHNFDLENLVLVPRKRRKLDGTELLSRFLDVEPIRGPHNALRATMMARIANFLGVSIKGPQEK